MSLVIYNSEKTNLSPISFVNDIKNQTAIRNIDTNSPEFKKELGFLFAKVNNLIGIKDEIEMFNKKDILELILMRFKALSLEELDYAFKLERFGTHGKRIEHFQLFNAEYVGKVLDRYLQWKAFQLKNVVKNVKSQSIIKLTEEQKEVKNNNIILRFLEKYEQDPFIESNQFYIYDILDKKGLMPTDIEYKNQVKQDAIMLLKNEFSNKKAETLSEFRGFSKELKQISLGKGGAVVNKCKILVLEEFFRNLYKDQSNVIEFKQKFK